MLTVAPVTDGLPDGADQGFRLVEGDDVIMFFYWYSNPGAGQTSYADVLACLPDRLNAMGYDDQQPRILGQIVDRFGAGT